MIKADYHVHTCFSSDSTARVESVIEQAIHLGFERICITDHMDYDYPKETGLSFLFDPDEYFDKLEQLRHTYKKNIKILTGVELGLRPHVADQCRLLVEQYDFDFIIGSTHLVNNQDPYDAIYWKGISETEGINRYLRSIPDNLAAFDQFQIYGHIDYVIRYAPNKNKYYSYEAYHDIIDQILTTLISAGKGIEINTAGYKHGLGCANPQTDVIKRYLELGGDIITIGSDAHSPEFLGYEFGRASDMLRSIGVTHYTVFEKKKPIFLPL